MPVDIPTSASNVTRGWLARTLDAEIREVSAHANPAFNSSVVHLHVSYASNPRDLPGQVLVKVNRDHDGQNEVQFYRFAAEMHLSMLPRALGIEYDPASGFSYLLLEDLSATHAAPVTREQLIALEGVPPVEQAESIVDALAEFHAAFWEHPGFGSVPVTTEMRWWYRDAEWHGRHVERRAGEWEKFVAAFGNEVTAEWVELGAGMLQKLPRLFEGSIQPRLSRGRGLTMSQGDCYLSQFLVPRAEAGQIYLADFQDASVNFPTYDLVYLFATFWTRTQRAQYEERLLRRYLDGLQGGGVKYDWGDLCDDYRLCLCYMFFDAIWNATAGSRREYWFPKLQCLVDACQDWDCAGWQESKQPLY